MRLKALSIKNFKGIDERGVHIELAPVTLLFGPNNVGKSTVVQALHLAREAFRGAIPDKIEASQHGVELGTFKDYVHQHELSRIIHICFSFDVAAEHCKRMGNLAKHIDELLRSTAKKIDVEISIQWNEKIKRAELSDYIMHVNGKKFAALQNNPIEPTDCDKCNNFDKPHAESFLCVYDITPFISDANMESLKRKRDELIHRLPKADQLEQARLFFNSTEWKDFLQSYFEAVPKNLFSVSNVNSFLKQVGIATEFLDAKWLDELYEKPFYTTEEVFLDFDNIFKCLLEDFPNDLEFINELINSNLDPHLVFRQLITHFQDDFDSIKRLCEHAHGTYKYFEEYYRELSDIHTDNFYWDDPFLEKPIFRSPEEDTIEARKEHIYKKLIDNIQHIFSIYISKSMVDQSPDEQDGFVRAAIHGHRTHWGGKRFNSISDYIFYNKFIECEPAPYVRNNSNHKKYPSGSVSLVRELFSPVKFKYESLYDELVYSHFPESISHSEWNDDPITTGFLSLFSWPIEEIGLCLDSLLYVGPLRKIPERGSNGLWYRELDVEPSKANWSDGTGAWDWMSTASNEMLDELNSKLSGTGSLETGFIVKRHQYLRLEKGSDLFHALAEVHQAGFEKAAESPLRELLEQVPAEVQLNLLNARTGLETEPYNMGTGVSQVLPIVAAAVAANGKLTLLEQPELHIHPKLQTTLGDIFLTATSKGSMFLLETHSEHLMLRLLRRIRETSEGNLPEGAPAATINDVAVNYIQKDANDCTEAVNIAITPDGDFARQWPNGFFAERAEELF